MILKIFNGRNELLQFIIVIAFSVLIFFQPVAIAENSGFNPLYDLFIGFINGNQILLRVFFILLVVSPIILTQFFIESNAIIERRNKHFLFIAPLLIFSNPVAWVLSPPLVSLIFIVISFGFVVNSDENDKSIASYSSAAIFLSIGSMFYSIIGFNIILLFLALKLFKQFRIRDFFAVMLSFIVPYLYLFTYYFVNDELAIKWTNFTDQFFNFGFDISFGNNTFDTVYIIILLLISIFVVSTIAVNQRNNLIQVRKFNSFIFWGLLNSLLLVLIAGDNSLYHFIIITFFVAIFYSIFLASKKLVWIFEIIISFYLLHTLYIMWLF